MRVARGIDAEMKASGADCVFLDITHKPARFLMERFPNIYQTCKQYGVDLTIKPIPVVPAAHYTCGGVLVDEWGRTSLGNLLAFGETACTGLHGANRLASNSLLEAVVFAHRGRSGCRTTSPRSATCLACGWMTGAPAGPRYSTSRCWSSTTGTRCANLWNYVALSAGQNGWNSCRTASTWMLQEIKDHFYDYLLTPDLVELRNLAVVAELIVQSASRRKESRGLHYILDYPDKNDRDFLRDTVLQKG